MRPFVHMIALALAVLTAGAAPAQDVDTAGTATGVPGSGQEYGPETIHIIENRDPGAEVTGTLVLPFLQEPHPGSDNAADIERLGAELQALAERQDLIVVTLAAVVTAMSAPDEGTVETATDPDAQPEAALPPDGGEPEHRDEPNPGARNHEKLKGLSADLRRMVGDQLRSMELTRLNAELRALLRQHDPLPTR